MNVLICGSRVIRRYAPVEKALNDFMAENPNFIISLLISGGAKGIDTLAENWGIQRGIEIKRYLPDWSRFGISAGFKRNSEMVEVAQAIIAIFPQGLRTNGTMDTVRKGKAKGIPVHILEVIP